MDATLGIVPTFLIVVVAALVIVFGLWALVTARRLHALHIRTDSALNSLRFALDRRVAIAAALHPELHVSAAQTEAVALRHEHVDARSKREREFTRELQLLYPNTAEVPDLLVDSEIRVELASRFYNEAVSDTRALRLKPLVKALRLGGTAPMPTFFDLDLVTR